jgi:tetratricopeptide (TPR) repeat protein
VHFRRGLCWATFVAASLASFAASASDSSDELVRQARAHEAANEDDLAARRYTEALTVDALSAPAWLGLADLRMRTGDIPEAERVYSAALARLPLLTEALRGRAHARWLSGRHAEAAVDLEAFATSSGGPGAYRELAGWYGVDGRSSAQLATWRRILNAVPDASEALKTEARRMVRALVIIVGNADPACSPFDQDPTRLALASICLRGDADSEAPVSRPPSKTQPRRSRRPPRQPHAHRRTRG